MNRDALAQLLHDHRPEPLLPPLLVSGCKCGWGSEVFDHSAHLADVILAALPSLAPAGETVTEWRVESDTTEDEFGQDEQAARDWLARCEATPEWEPVVLMRRTVTTTTSKWGVTR